MNEELILKSLEEIFPPQEQVRVFVEYCILILLIFFFFFFVCE